MRAKPSFERKEDRKKKRGKKRRGSVL